MNIENLSLADLYALYWHFCDLSSDKEDETNYVKDPNIILDACRMELNKRLISIHNSIILK